MGLWRERSNGEMKKSRRAVAALLLAVSPLVAVAQNGGKFVAPRLVSAGEISYPMNSKSAGIVTLQLNLAANGGIQNALVVRDVPPLTSAAQTAVRTWSFTPARLNREGIPSSIEVTVVFNPFNPAGVGLPNPGFTPPVNTGSVPYIPAQALSATYAVYPPNSVASGTVVLDVKIGSKGGVKDVSVVHGVAALTGPAITAARTWSFRAAQRNEKAAESHTIVAFVFPSPAVGTP
jgi:TonB family protein